MKEQVFEKQVELLFLAIEHWLEAAADEIDFESNEGRLKMSIHKSQFILSKQTTLNEIWLATPQGAYHFHFQDHAWITNQNEELISTLASAVNNVTALSLSPKDFTF